jgi:hypothetical protein
MLPRPRHVPVRFFIFLITVEVVIVREEEVGGTDTHEMDILVPHTGSVAGSLRSVSTSTGQVSMTRHSQSPHRLKVWHLFALAVSSRVDYSVQLQDPGREAMSLR